MYSYTKKGYRCYIPTLCHSFILIDFAFDESQSYFFPLVGSDSSLRCLPRLLPVSPIESHSQKPFQVYHSW